MKSRDSIREKLGNWFTKASDLMKRNQVLFVHRVVHSHNKAVRDIALATKNARSSRVWNSVELVEVNYKRIFVSSCKELKTLLKSV